MWPTHTGAGRGPEVLSRQSQPLAGANAARPQGGGGEDSAVTSLAQDPEGRSGHGFPLLCLPLTCFPPQVCQVLQRPHWHGAPHTHQGLWHPLRHHRVRKGSLAASSSPRPCQSLFWVGQGRGVLSPLFTCPLSTPITTPFISPHPVLCRLGNLTSSQP